MPTVLVDGSGRRCFVVVGDYFFIGRPLGPQCWKMEEVVGVLWVWVIISLREGFWAHSVGRWKSL